MRLPKLMVCILWTCYISVHGFVYMTLLGFCLILPGVKDFTDYRCFHFSHREVTVNVVTSAIEMCECMPDALSAVWGDADQVWNPALRHFSFITSKQKIIVCDRFISCNFFFQLPLCLSWGTPINCWTTRIGGRRNYSKFDHMLFRQLQLIQLVKWKCSWKTLPTAW